MAVAAVGWPMERREEFGRIGVVQRGMNTHAGMGFKASNQLDF